MPGLFVDAPNLNRYSCVDVWVRYDVDLAIALYFLTDGEVGVHGVVVVR